MLRRSTLVELYWVNRGAHRHMNMITKNMINPSTDSLLANSFLRARFLIPFFIRPEFSLSRIRSIFRSSELFIPHLLTQFNPRIQHCCDDIHDDAGHKHQQDTEETDDHDQGCILGAHS